MIPNRFFFAKLFAYSDLKYIFAVRKGGAIAQSVEQWTENPCVPGSIPGGTTSLNSKIRKINILRIFVLSR
jgi:5-methylthioribose kinase